MAEQPNLATHSADWRQQLQLNSRRTFYIISLFLLLYLAIGLLIDLFIQSSLYIDTQAAYQNQPSLEPIFINLVTFRITPWATIVMLGIAVISLLITYSMHAKMMLLGTEYLEITSDNTEPDAKQLYNVVEEMKVAAGLQYMPRIFIIEADYMNAFASGYSEKSAMIAITRGLMTKLTRAELQAVMAHELSHIRHGDIRLTLTASVLSNLMVMAIDILFYQALFSGNRRDRDGGRNNRLFLIIMLVRFVLPLLNIVLMLYLSRTREYMADAGCVELQRDNQPLISALLKIHKDHRANADAYGRAYNQTTHENVRREAYIYDPIAMGIETIQSPADWLSTHPSLAKRLAALGFTGSID
jgi:heat shock protein HtpX